ncbi:MAG TPA: glycosyltransferase family 1 protein [Rhizomicrobium sp.]|nr:glycosyltransferase family 1 protein [Rhizomicrobium sp.]
MRGQSAPSAAAQRIESPAALALDEGDWTILHLRLTGAPTEAHTLKILIVTDAWAPQINGVVRTLEILGKELQAFGHEVRYATPEGRLSVPLPTYQEIRLSVLPRRSLEKLIDEYKPDNIHIATEGTLGLAARNICVDRRLAFTTAFHSRFPEYVHVRFPFVPKSLVYSLLRWFHAPAYSMMVATQSLKRELESHGFANARIWSRGVDVEKFRPIEGAALPYPKPVWLYVGRVSVEKNIEAFLSLDLPGSKVVVGDGPARAHLERKYPAAHFLGTKTGEDLVRAYSASDVFVFPSKTDTFGLVVLEALACGTPVAAYPVQGPQDVVGDAPVAALDNDLREACLHALEIPGSAAREFAMKNSWRACTEQFLANLPPSIQK